ncbi:MAG TPA: alpha/beta hydrolase-fold protein [Pirellulales bacterium]|nr:alpha/beta hydrolase-fold protein [Pirellulales bacterium]
MTNRLPSILSAPQIGQMANVASSVSAARYAAHSSSAGEVHAAVFAPMHYEPNYAYPLLVWLHGPGDDESQLKRVMPLVSMRNYVAVAPRGPCRDGRQVGRSGYGWSQAMADWSVAEQRTFDAIEMALARFHVSTRRIFLAGYDCGGTMAFRLGMDHPERFAGVLSLCGPFPGTQTPLRRLSDARRVPLFLACGRDSQSYPTAEVCDHLRLFHSAGMNISLRQYPCGHEIVPAMLADMDRWMMEQISTGSSPATNSEPSAR